MTSQLKTTLTDDMKRALKAGDKARLGTIRLALAAIGQREVDTREQLTDAEVLGVLEKMVKQRRDSQSQYEAAGREDLAEQERYEIGVLTDYLPQPLTDDEIDALVDQAVSETGAGSVREMGAVMGWLKPKLTGRADMKSVSGKVRERLTG